MDRDISLFGMFIIALFLGILIGIYVFDYFTFDMGEATATAQHIQMILTQVALTPVP